jgi:hypothetical protein
MEAPMAEVWLETVSARLAVWWSMVPTVLGADPVD